jgi:hypothetical protein
MKGNSLKLLALSTRIIIVTLLMACLFSTLAPSAFVVNAFGIGGGMACCIGKSAGHCHVALQTKRPQPISEPMCGLKSDTVDDRLTIVADETAAEVETDGVPGRRLAAVANPCATDSCACSAAAKQQQKRRHASVVTQPQHILPTRLSWTGETTSFLSKSNGTPDPFSPRGPPCC